MRQLISQAEIEALPEDPRQRFIGIEALCRERLLDRTDREEHWAPVEEARAQYLSTVIAAAKFLRVEPFASMDVPKRKDFHQDAYDQFIQDVQFYAMQMMLEAAEANTRTSIVLQGSTRQRVGTLVAHIREHVQRLDIDPAKLDRLLSRIAAFEREMAGDRLRLISVAVFALAICAGVSDIDGTGNAIGKLINQMQEVIGQAKDTQDAETAAQLPEVTSPRRLEAPRKSEVEDFSKAPEFDDEIPF